MASDDDIRIGNPEREHVVRVLNDAFAAGYLDMDEFEQRAGAVYLARTRGELRPLLGDLPNGKALFGAADSATAAQPAVPPERLDIDWDTVRRKGHWEVPTAISVTGSMGTLILDFTRARFGSLMVEIDLSVSASTVKIKLGPEHEVRYSGLKKSGWSSIKDKAGDPARRGGQVITLTGAVVAASSVTIKRG